MAVSAAFYKNLMRWVYGLLTADGEGRTVPFEVVDRQEVFRPFYDEAAVARVNCKKQVGGSSLGNGALRWYLERYGDLLGRQIGLYDAEILLCCGGSGLIRDFLRERCLPDLRRVNDWMHASPSTGKLVVDSWHPSYRGETHRGMYEGMMTAYREYLKGRF